MPTASPGNDLFFPPSLCIKESGCVLAEEKPGIRTFFLLRGNLLSGFTATINFIILFFLGASPLPI